MRGSTIEELTTALERQNGTLAADVPNFTDIQPLLQISDVAG